MAATVTGTPVFIAWGGGANPAAQNITVPADATAVYVFAGGYDGGSAGNGLLSFTLGGVAASETQEIAGSADPSLFGCVAIWYNPATGVKSLDPAWDADMGSLGPSCLVVFVKGGNTTAARDKKAVHGVDTAAVTTTLTTVAGDLVLKYDQRCFEGAAPALSAGFTNVIFDDDENGMGCRVSSIVATGTTQVCNAEGENYSVVVAVSIPAAAGGGGAKPWLHFARMMAQ